MKKKKFTALKKSLKEVLKISQNKEAKVKKILVEKPYDILDDGWRN